MRTKLGIFSDRILEAGWLLAVALIPLFFNAYSFRTFEPDKLSILRSLALIMACAWIIKLSEGGMQSFSGSRGTQAGPGTEPPETHGLFHSILSQPLVIPVALFFFAYLVSTLLSILPTLSMKGSYTRLQGTFSIFSYLVIFFAMVANLRSRDQLDRLLDTIILASIPITLYTLLQHYGLDFMGWSQDMRDRPGSNMGNPIFLAAYLIMVLPITLYRIVEFYPSIQDNGGKGIFRIVLFSFYVCAAMLQFVSILFSQSRGPWLGISGGLFLFILVALILLWRTKGGEQPLTLKDAVKAFLFALGGIATLIIPGYLLFLWKRKGFRWLWIAFIFQAAFLISFVAVLNLSKGPISALKDAPYIGRLGHLTEAEFGTAKVRAIIWRGTVELIASNPLRMVMGYGPETMKHVWDPFSPPELAHHEARNAAPDRSHNEAFDLIVTTGLVGFSLYMFLVGSILYFSLKWLGLIRTRGQGVLFVFLSLAGMAAGLVGPRVVQGSWFLSGVGVPVGFVSGLFAYVIISRFTGALKDGLPRGRGLPQSLLILALLSAVVAHFIEIQVGIAIASTRLYFFVYAALLSIIGVDLIKERAPLAAATAQAKIPEAQKHEKVLPRKQTQRKANAPAAHKEQGIGSLATGSFFPQAAISALILFTIAFISILNLHGESDPFSIVALSLSQTVVNGESQFSVSILLLLLSSFGAGLIISLSRIQPSPGAPLLTKNMNNAVWIGMGIYAALTGVVFLVGAVIRASLIVPEGDPARIIPFFYAASLFFLVALAAALPRPGIHPVRFCRSTGAWAYPVLLIVTFWAIISAVLLPAKADVYAKSASSMEQRREWNSSVDLYNGAIALAPEEDFYYLCLGRTLFGKAGQSATAREKDVLCARIYELMDKAHTINPLNTDHLGNLGLLFLRWAEIDPSPEGKREKLKKAHTYYEMAAKGSPRKIVIFNSWAKVFAAQGDYEGAIGKLKYSLSVDDKIGATYFVLGDL